jgi:hypothetical protein
VGHFSAKNGHDLNAGDLLVGIVRNNRERAIVESLGAVESIDHWFYTLRLEPYSLATATERRSYIHCPKMLR